MRKKQVTILELATRLGLSPSTVSRALNGKHRISEATQNRVRNLARELGYQPNTSARHLRENRSYTVGILMSSLETRLNTMLLEAFVAKARSIDHHVIMQLGQDESVLNFLLTNHLDGIFLFHDNKLSLSRMTPIVRSRSLPLVIIGDCRQQASKVWIDPGKSLTESSRSTSTLVDSAFRLLFEEQEMIEMDEPLTFQEIVC